MRKSWMAAPVGAAALTSCSTNAEQAQVAQADPHAGLAAAASKAAGEAVYKQHCAICHDNPDATKSPSREALSRVSALYVTNALIMGKMTAQGAPLFAVEVSNVSDYGGSIDAASIIATHGLMIMNSGYGMFGQAPGNVMIEEGRLKIGRRALVAHRSGRFRRVNAYGVAKMRSAPESKARALHQFCSAI